MARWLSILLLAASGLAASGLALAQAVATDPAVRPPAAAPQARPLAEDPVLEAEVLRIAHELRCLVCQNETIAASNADLALDLRNQIRQQLRAGRSEREILDYMVQRYGDFVLYKPPVKPITWLLWGGPFVLLVAMLATLWHLLRRRRAEGPGRALSEDERRQARALLGTENE